MADSGLLESAEVGSQRLSGPSGKGLPRGARGIGPQIRMFLSGPPFPAQIEACLTQKLGQESPPRVPLMPVEKLRAELHNYLILRLQENFSIEHFQELVITHPQTVTILYWKPLLIFSHVFLILPQYIVVSPVPQALSRSRASAVKGFHKMSLLWLDSSQLITFSYFTPIPVVSFAIHNSYFFRTIYSG